ncbi:MAG: PcfJ domain-containing protein [Gimesia chilikensis]
MQAPQDLTILQALRWGQVLGMGGDPGLGRAIMQSPFPEELSNDQFWTTVIQWLIHHASLDRRQIQSIIEFLRYQRFGVFTIPGDNGVYDEVDAPAPDYSIKGRTPRSLLRDVADWHREQEQKSKIPECTWDASGIREFDFEDENRWMIREILTSDDLVTEGNQMKHCVASYIGNCTGGESSIWSMQIELQQGFKKAITIEVRKDNNLISEVRGKANRLPNPRERNVLRRWAETAGLKFSRYVNV